jgi:nicotinamidase-related amidase
MSDKISILELDPRRTALILIDPQQWTLGMPIAPQSAAMVVNNAERIGTALRRAGGIVVLTRAAFSEGYADMLRAPVDLQLKVPPGGIPPEALAFDPVVERMGYDLVLTKRQWSAFYGTELDLQLRRRAIDTVLLGGVMTNFGVESTARDAWQHNHSVIAVADMCSSLNADMHRFSIEHILPRISRVRSTRDILHALGDSEIV